MKALIQTGSSLSACGHAQAGGRVSVPPEKRFLINKCAICGCPIHRDGDYAKPTVRGRSHATRHHHVAKRFFGRSANRRGTTRDAIFAKCPWDAECTTSTFCYECHEELIHNPVFLPEDIHGFAELVKARGLDEPEKTDERSRLAGRIKLLHEVIKTGLKEMNKIT